MIKPSTKKCSAMRLLLICLLVFSLVGCGAGGDSTSVFSGSSAASSSSVPQVSSLPPPPEPDPEPVEQRVHFSAVGDNLIHSAIFVSAQQQAQAAGGDGYDFTYCYENCEYFFQQFDVNWINQETLVNNELEASTYPNFSTPGELGQAAYDAGWRVFALSNNHTYDKGSAGISATLRYWESMPDDVVHYGLYTNREDDSGIAIQEVNGITIAYVAFTDSTNGIPFPSGSEAFVIMSEEVEAMERKVRYAREMADVLVVSMHWGWEDNHTISPHQQQQAQNLADWGADVVIGTHPHVVQDLEFIESADGRQVLVAYSLGNFLSAQSKHDQLIGLCLTFDLVQTLYPDGTKSQPTVEEVKVYPTVTQYEYYGGQYYSNPRTYMYRDYTDELAATHFQRTKGSWSRDSIRGVIEAYVTQDYVVYD